MKNTSSSQQSQPCFWWGVVDHQFTKQSLMGILNSLSSLLLLAQMCMQKTVHITYQRQSVKHVVIDPEKF
jgi:hypothetical protein